MLCFYTIFPISQVRYGHSTIRLKRKFNQKPYKYCSTLNNHAIPYNDTPDCVLYRHNTVHNAQELHCLAATCAKLLCQNAWASCSTRSHTESRATLLCICLEAWHMLLQWPNMWQKCRIRVCPSKTCYSFIQPFCTSQSYSGLKVQRWLYYDFTALTPRVLTHGACIFCGCAILQDDALGLSPVIEPPYPGSTAVRPQSVFGSWFPPTRSKRD